MKVTEMEKRLARELIDEAKRCEARAQAMRTAAALLKGGEK